MKLSVIIPVFNEQETIEKVISSVQDQDIDKEIIIVDDCSTDKTRDVLKEIIGSGQLKILYHKRNMGKGAAIRTGIKNASGDAVIIQDADLEYDPSEYKKLVDEMEKNGADVVYGSRFLSGKNNTPGWHYLVNKFLTILTNILYRANLTDMETCYKLMKKSVLDKIPLNSDRFEIEAELTAKFLKNGIKIKEVPITYRGRWYHQGKKITWIDGVKTLFALFKYKFSD